MSVELSIADGLGRLTLSRPEHGNRVTSEMMQELIDRLVEAREADPSVLVIEGAGPDFTLGREQVQGSTLAQRRAGLSLAIQAGEALRAIPGVVLAAVRGRAMGFGCGLVVQSDLAIAEDRSELGFDEIHKGFAPTIVMTYLADRVGSRRAADLVLTGRALDARAAEAFGIVTRVVAPEDFDTALTELTAELCSFDGRALRHAKRYLRAIADVPQEQRGAIALEEGVAFFADNETGAVR